MVKGSCVCGDWTYEYEGEPAAVAVCHCVPCRKTAGTTGSVNSIIPNDKVVVVKDGSEGLQLTSPQFKQLSGTDRTFTRKGDSTQVSWYLPTKALLFLLIAGQDVTYHNCATCGTIMWVEIAAMQGLTVVKTGTIDEEDALNQAKPVTEMYCTRRPASVPEIAGIEHKDTA
jgi:hypothetical protein